LPNGCLTLNKALRRSRFNLDSLRGFCSVKGVTLSEQGGLCQSRVFVSRYGSERNPMRIAVMTDVHANLPALEAALESIRAEGYDAIFHTGDAIAIGPFPAECLDLLLNIPNIQFVMGNHDAYFVHGLPTPQPAWLSDGEVRHQRWTHSRLDPHMRSVLANWPLLLEHDLEGVRTLFVHYALAPSGQDFWPVIKDPTVAELDRIFAFHDAGLIFYGHHHRRSDKQGRARYVNPGSLGCHSEPVARYCVVELQGGQYRVEHRGVPYDDGRLLAAFEQRGVPEREFIYHAFFGGRFSTELGGHVG
jgi:putative phosphoesterase